MSYICTRKTKESSLKQGQLPEWPNGADCNSAGVAFGGSNPSLPTNFKLQLLEIVISLKFVYASPHYGSKKHSESGLCVRNNTFCGNSSVDRALAFQAGGRGFESRFPLSE